MNINTAFYTVREASVKKETRINFLLISSLFVILLAASLKKEVTLTVDGESRAITTYSQNVAELLEEAEVVVSEKDNISHSLSARLKNGMDIRVKKAFIVKVYVDNEEHIGWTTNVTVAQLLSRLNIKLGDMDRVLPSLDEKVQPGTKVDVIRVSQEIATRRTEVQFREIRRANKALDRGESRVIQRGVYGLREDTLEITLENDKEVAARVVQSLVLRPKQDRIVEYGANTTLSRGGSTMTFKRVISMAATAYCPGTKESGCPIDSRGYSKCTGRYSNGITASGRPAIAGEGTRESPHIAAVDRRVIPLGTMMYIDGLGFAVAADVGGAIKGNRVDILKADHKSALRFGRRNMRIYVLQ